MINLFWKCYYYYLYIFYYVKEVYELVRYSLLVFDRNLEL